MHIEHNVEPKNLGGGGVSAPKAALVSTPLSVIAPPRKEKITSLFELVERSFLGE